MEQEFGTGIYLITHIATGRPYVGLTRAKTGFSGRWNGHRKALRNNKYSTDKPHLQNAWNKYGEDAFSFSVHTYVPQGDRTMEEFLKVLAEEEVRILALYPENFNSMQAGATGMTHLPDVCAKISNANREKMKDPQYRAKKVADVNSPVGLANRIAKNKSPKIRALRRKQKLEQMKDPDLKARIISGIHSPESQARATEGKRKKWQDPEWAKKMKNILKTTGNSPSALKKRGNSMKKLWQTPEHRNKVEHASSEVWKNRKRDSLRYSEFCENVSAGVRKSLSEKPELLQQRSDRFKSKEHRKKVSASSSSLWADPIRRAALLEKRKLAMASPEYRAKQGAATAERHRKRREAKLKPSDTSSALPQPDPSESC
jgi:hypothetical protein